MSKVSDAHSLGLPLVHLGAPCCLIVVEVFYIDGRTSIPATAVGTTTPISVLSTLIGLGSCVAFNSIISITVVGLYASYLMGAILLLWRRLQGSIRPSFGTSIGSTIVNAPKCSSGLGIFQNATYNWSCGKSRRHNIYDHRICFRIPATCATGWTGLMKYACLVFGGTVLFSIGCYFSYARKMYKSPILEIER